jgi:L-alanine-DL-glutamate epimerase-like enolase superfamily enzyme
MNFAQLVRGGPTWSSGTLLLNQTPGVGVDLDLEAVDAAAMHPWRTWEI